MAYNGVGLFTPRGSGTNGYVQRNLSHVRNKRVDVMKQLQDFSDMKPPTQKKANLEILRHEAKRKIELKVMEYKESLVTLGMSSEEINRKVDNMRKTAMEDFERAGDSYLKDPMASGSATHQKNLVKERENVKIAAAFGLGDQKGEWKEGQGFRQMEEDMKKKKLLAEGGPAALAAYQHAKAVATATANGTPIPSPAKKDAAPTMKKSWLDHSVDDDTFDKRYPKNSGRRERTATFKYRGKEPKEDRRSKRERRSSSRSRSRSPRRRSRSRSSRRDKRERRGHERRESRDRDRRRRDRSDSRERRPRNGDDKSKSTSDGQPAMPADKKSSSSSSTTKDSKRDRSSSPVAPSSSSSKRAASRSRSKSKSKSKSRSASRSRSRSRSGSRKRTSTTSAAPSTAAPPPPTDKSSSKSSSKGSKDNDKSSGSDSDDSSDSDSHRSRRSRRNDSKSKSKSPARRRSRS